MRRTVIPEDVIEAAKKDPHCWVRFREKLAPISADGRVVGFYHPARTSAYGRRIGPVFVLPAYRRRGLVRSVYASIRGPLVAFVRDDNPDSMALHLACGFVRWRRARNATWLRRA